MFDKQIIASIFFTSLILSTYPTNAQTADLLLVCEINIDLEIYSKNEYSVKRKALQRISISGNQAVLARDNGAVISYRVKSDTQYFYLTNDNSALIRISRFTGEYEESRTSEISRVYNTGYCKKDNSKPLF